MEKIQVLVLDDERNVTRLTSSTLKLHGYEVTECNNPLEALEIVKDKAFALILVDLMMPQMQGLEVMRRIREMPQHADTRFIVLSGKRLEKEEKRSLFDLGAEIMQKPFFPNKLVETVQTVLR